MAQLIVFVHGWSVTNVDTYGELPVRIRNEAAAKGIDIKIKEIFLGKYISFHDEVMLNDISRAFREAVKDELDGLLKDGTRFICITHSTGGPVIRDWWNEYHIKLNIPCPMSHLIMLAPANYGSALAQLGKSRLSRIKSWFDGVEPGQGVLNWLELGSEDSWQLNTDWILGDDKNIGPKGVFPFVLTGQSIDRSLYDHLNSYTGELGSDGVVRVAAANLQASYIRLEQPVPAYDAGKKKFVSGDFNVSGYKVAPQVPLRIITGKSHSGGKMGIMNSVKKDANDNKSVEVVNAIFDCMNVKTRADYDKVYKKFDAETRQVQVNEKIERETRMFLSDRYFIHDRFSMVIFKVVDTEDWMVKDFDLVLTVVNEEEKDPEKRNDPNLLPEGFLADRQRNALNPETITYFFNFDILNGDVQQPPDTGNIRKKTDGIKTLGLEIRPRPSEGFVHYVPCKIDASKDLFDKVFNANSTTLIEICLQRLVYKEVFTMEKLSPGGMPTKSQGDFGKVKPGNKIVK